MTIERASPPAEDADGERALARAYEIAYAYVNRRERSEREVERHLLKRGVTPTLAERVLGELIDTRLVDDARFAQLVVSDKRELEQWGQERIRRGLVARGIDPGQAAAAVSAPSTGATDDEAEVESELDRALGLLRRRFPQPPEDRRERERALGVLLRKGYETELALDALSAYARGEE